MTMLLFTFTANRLIERGGAGDFDDGDLH